MLLCIKKIIECCPLHPYYEDLVVLGASKTCSNEPTGEDLCDRHVSCGYRDWELIGYGIIGGGDRIVLNTTHQMLVLSVFHIRVVIIF